MTTTADIPLEQLIVANPAVAATLDRLGLDFCCHGQDTLAQACSAAGVPLVDAQAALDAVVPATAGREWPAYGPSELARHIQTVHHDRLRAELPELVALSAKVTAVHSARHPELFDVDRLVRALHDDLIPHMVKEDQVLFPAIVALEAGPATFGFGTIANPIAVMTSEHETVGEILGQLRTVTASYQAPEDGCASYRLLYQRLADVEADTHLHVLKENSVLFPAARTLEAEQLDAGTAHAAAS